MLQIHNTVEEAIINELNVAKGDERFPLLRALKNLKSKSTIPKLLEIIKKGNAKDGVYAWKAIRAQDPSTLGNDVLDAALTTFYQLDRKHDSSSRTLAADVLLESQPSEETLRNLLYHLKSSDKAFEVKQYLLQRINMIADKDDHFAERVRRIIREDRSLNNYHVLGQKGLSTALTRSFLRSPSSNGSLLSIQEMHGGIVKRGIVNVVLEKDDISKEIFSVSYFYNQINLQLDLNKL